MYIKIKIDFQSGGVERQDKICDLLLFHFKSFKFIVLAFLLVSIKLSEINGYNNQFI